ncbi:MAG TPA: RsmE family RNA methyltransferase, partial [Lacunisphaera sp.]|nr:RsmE family RNA methyltransferase [Lacunisphaera sp.]
ADKKIEKWRTGAIEAAKQCGNPWLPEITPIVTFAEYLRWASVSPPTPVAALESGDHPYDLKLIASLHAGTTTLKKALATYAAKHGHAPRRVLWLVGPEGDFSPAEMTAALTAGCVPVTLGPLVLRSDTAAVYALSILSHELQNP